MFQRLIISCVDKEFTCDYIAKAFWKQQIAKVNKVTLTHSANKSCSVAFIDIEEWCDTESAYNFIKKIQSGKESRIVHSDPRWWGVKAIDNEDNLVSSLF